MLEVATRARRDGQVVQLVPFDQVAWHAGASQWKGLVGLKLFSLGVHGRHLGAETPVVPAQTKVHRVKA